MSPNDAAPGRQLEAIGKLFSSSDERSVPPAPPRSPAPDTQKPPASAAEPTPKRSRPTARPAAVAPSSALRVYASLPAEEVSAVRALAKSRGWSLLAVAAAALEEYSPELYAKEPSQSATSPLPGVKTNKRHGDTYLPLNIYNAEQARWLDTALRPYGNAVKSHLLGCALSHYLATQA